MQDQQLTIFNGDASAENRLLILEPNFHFSAKGCPLAGAPACDSDDHRIIRRKLPHCTTTVIAPVAVFVPDVPVMITA
jgi:hypothetical protein